MKFFYGEVDKRITKIMKKVSKRIPIQFDANLMGEVKNVDYKAVIEEQIKELQKVQDATVKQAISDPTYAHTACEVAETISKLIAHAQNS